MDEWRGRVEGRLDLHDDRLDRLEEETKRSRDRLHKVEHDRIIVRRLADVTADLAERVKELAGGVESIAERAVENVLKRRRDDRHKGWGFYAGWAGTAVGVLSFVVQHHRLFGL